MPENRPKSLRSAAMRGTVENPVEVGRTPWSAAGPLASLPRFRREPRKRRVFIALGGPQVHADRLAGAPSGSGGLSIRLPAANTTPENRPKSLQLAAMWGSQSWLQPASAPAPASGRAYARCRKLLRYAHRGGACFSLPVGQARVPSQGRTRMAG